MITRRHVGCLTLPALMVLTAGTLAAFAASNTVPSTHADDRSIGITANTLKPAACASLNLTAIVVGSGSLDGGSGNELILGSAGADTIRGRQGADCILGGAGGDDIQGNQDADVLLAGTGNDQLDGGNGPPGETDTCDGGAGTDTFSGCEVTLNDP
ncbi:MAG TPA: hypothetical protein VFI11_00860 [Anaerolineales bacterium]|nr:hypothetical protein [Anaerolineales bacterium]